MPTPSQEYPASSKTPNQDLKDIDVVCTCKSRKHAKIQNMGVQKTSGHIKIKIQIPNSSQDPPASSETPNQDLKDMDVLCTFKIKIESQNSDHLCVKDQRPYPNQDQDFKPQLGTSTVLQSLKSLLKEQRCSLHL